HLLDRQTFKQRRSAALAEWRALRPERTRILSRILPSESGLHWFDSSVLTAPIAGLPLGSLIDRRNRRSLLAHCCLIRHCEIGQFWWIVLTALRLLGRFDRQIGAATRTRRKPGEAP